MRVACPARCASEALLAVHRDDLPAAQAFSGNSDLLIAPAWRLPRELRDWIEVGAWLRERLRVQHGLTGGEIFDLGGPYRPSPGLSPELVHPVAIPIKEIAGGASGSLAWVPLTDCVRSRTALGDGHLPG